MGFSRVLQSGRLGHPHSPNMITLNLIAPQRENIERLSFVSLVAALNEILENPEVDPDFVFETVLPELVSKSLRSLKQDRCLVSLLEERLNQQDRTIARMIEKNEQLAVELDMSRTEHESHLQRIHNMTTMLQRDEIPEAVQVFTSEMLLRF